MKGSMILLPLANSEMLGAMVIYSRHTKHFDDDKINLFVELSEDTAYGIHTLRLREDLLRTSSQRDDMLRQLRESLEGTVHSIAMMVEARDPYTAGHQTRVSNLAVEIAKELDLDSNTIEGIHVASQVHDIGKIQIPSEILTKPTKLTNLEYEMIKTHPTTGYEILKNINFPWPIADIVHQHHERLDGTGYPNGMSSKDILLEAKIVCVADVVEAMASHRPYRASLGIEFALTELERERGTKYDTDVVDCCLKLFREKNYVLSTQ
jgi:putative nucleotidyltransferase with HDIG domain